MLINLFDLVHELIESALPLTTVGDGEDISIILESLKLFDLLLYLVDLIINLCGITGNGFEVRTENGIELLNDDASFLKVLEDSFHVDRFLKDFLLSGEVPSLDSAVLNVSLSVLILHSPLMKNRLALLDNVDGIIWLFLEDLGNVDLVLNLVADFI